MKSPLLSLILLLLLTPFAVARTSDGDSVAQARAMLEPHVWSQAIIIRNPRRAGNLPAHVQAAVFSFQGVLWLYIPNEGTRSLSHRRGRLDIDRANLLPLLQEIHSGFAGYEVVPSSGPAAETKAFPKLRNGCFIESLHALVRLMDEGVTPSEAGLFTVYVQGPKGLQGHTGLYYRTPAGRFFWDPDRPEAPLRVGGGLDDRDQVAREVRSDARWEILRTHVIPVEGDPRQPVWDRPVAQAEGVTAGLGAG